MNRAERRASGQRSGRWGVKKSHHQSDFKSHDVGLRGTFNRTPAGFDLRGDQPSKPVGTYIGMFEYNDQYYTHFIYTSDGDYVDCVKADSEEIVLRFDSSCNVFDYQNGMKKIGEMHADWQKDTNNPPWSFSLCEGEKTWAFGKDNLKAEIEVSKLFVAGLLK